VLIKIAQRLLGSIREQDLVSRIGGDEFVVLLPRLKSVDELANIAERLISEVRSPVIVGEHECAVTASIGFALYDHDADDARSLVVKADVAMYGAKRDPDKPWLVWDEPMGFSVPGS
jgi:diguanylate cyclase (GGDEF)-like protein